MDKRDLVDAVSGRMGTRRPQPRRSTPSSTQSRQQSRVATKCRSLDSAFSRSRSGRPALRGIRPPARPSRCLSTRYPNSVRAPISRLWSTQRSRRAARRDRAGGPAGPPACALLRWRCRNLQSRPAASANLAASSGPSAAACRPAAGTATRSSPTSSGSRTWATGLAWC